MNRSFSLACLILAAQISSAQDTYFSVPFKAAPLTINPAFTGMFNGNFRATGIYQHDWQDLSADPFVSVGLGVDMPVMVTKRGSYFAAGLQTVKIYLGDGSRTNSNVTASLAWHMPLGKQVKDHTRELSVGLQGGYASVATNVNYWIATHPFQQVPLGFGHSMSYYVVNTGINYAQSLSARFNYSIGIAGYNLNRPVSELDRSKIAETVLPPTYITAAGANWILSKRITLAPAILMRTTDTRNIVISGSEVQYNLFKSRSKGSLPYIFAGVWYGTGNLGTVTMGVATRAIRLTAGNSFGVNRADILGGFQIQCSYIAPRRRATPSIRVVPSDRF